MSATNGWFPKISSSGRIISGDVELWLTDGDSARRLAVGGGQKAWLTPDAIVFNTRHGSTQIISADGDLRDIIPVGYNDIDANEQGKWAGFRSLNPGYLDIYEGANIVGIIPAATHARWEGNTLAYLTPYQASFRALRVGSREERTGILTEFDIGPNVVAVEATGVYTRRLIGTPTLADDEGWPVVEDGWVLTISDKGGGLLIRPVGQAAGYRLLGKEWYYPHFRLINGVLIIAASSSKGELRVTRINTLDPREDLRVPVPPPPITSPAPVGKSMKLPELVKQARNTFAITFPVPQADFDHESQDAFEDRCRAWIFRMAEYIRFVTADPSWGTKRADSIRPPSKDAIAKSGSVLLGWDLLFGTGTGKPTLVADPDSANITGQTFIPVKPVDHVGNAGSSGSGASGGQTNPVPDSKIEALARQVAALTAEIAAMKFTMIRSGDGVAFRTANNHLICAEGGGGDEVNASRTDIGSWETFRIVKS